MPSNLPSILQGVSAKWWKGKQMHFREGLTGEEEGVDGCTCISLVRAPFRCMHASFLSSFVSDRQCKQGRANFSHRNSKGPRKGKESTACTTQQSTAGQKRTETTNELTSSSDTLSKKKQKKNIKQKPTDTQKRIERRDDDHFASTQFSSITFD
mmetsp:Transcript_26076/g.51164  ORF Transcript_26076/g.51164 Transcript_26076/m.51164 type:complete len:154 (-) Transcript_26076:835-1296(-)